MLRSYLGLASKNKQTLSQSVTEYLDHCQVLTIAEGSKIGVVERKTVVGGGALLCLSGEK